MLDKFHDLNSKTTVLLYFLHNLIPTLGPSSRGHTVHRNAY